MSKVLSFITSLVLVVVVISGVTLAQETLNMHVIMDTQSVRYLRDQVIDEFEEEFGVTVNVEYVGWGNREEKLLLQTTAGVPPDIFMNGAQHICELAKAGLVEPLDARFEAWGKDIRDFHPVTLGSSTWEGHHYGLPLYTNTRVWWYWKPMLAASGLDPDNPPTTWDEILQAAGRLTQREDDRIVVEGYDLSRCVYGSDATPLQDFMVFMWQNGSEVLDPITHKATFATEKGFEVMDFLLDLKHKVQPPGFARAGTPFASKGSAIYLSPGIPIPPNMANAAVADVGAIPALERVEKNSVNFSDWLAIHAQSKNKDLAWELFKRLFAADVLMGLNSITGTLSPRMSTVKGLVYRNPLARYPYESMEYARPYPIYPKVQELGKAFASGYHPAIQEKQDPRTSMAEAQRLWNVILAED